MFNNLIHILSDLVLAVVVVVRNLHIMGVVLSLAMRVKLVQHIRVTQKGIIHHFTWIAV